MGLWPDRAYLVGKGNFTGGRSEHLSEPECTCPLVDLMPIWPVRRPKKPVRWQDMQAASYRVHRTPYYLGRMLELV